MKAPARDGLLALEGLAPMLDDRASASAVDARSLARALAAEEVLTSRLDCAPPLCRASLSRISAADGRVLWSDDFDVPSSDRSLLAPAVIGRLARAYPEHPPRPGLRRRPLDAERYDRLLRLRLAHLERARPAQELLAELETLRSEAPAAPEIYLLQAEVAHDRYFYSRRAEDLELVMERLAQAHDLAPRDPQALFRLSRVAIEAGRLDEARRAIGTLAELAPGDARVELRRALLLEREGAAERASALLRRSVERHPSWRSLFELASLCYRRGDLECSRRRLGELLERMPENASARSFLAQLELTSGEPRRAEELYLQIVENAPGVAELSNLGLARLLLGRFDDAAASFRRALELEPDEVLTRLNLANAEELRGRVDAARLLYEEVLARTEGSAGDDWQRATARAQALAHLGRARPAVRELQAALLAADGQPQAAFEAAIVYARLGDAISAAVHAERARAVFSRHWFELPFFDGVRGDPDFVDSLD